MLVDESLYKLYKHKRGMLTAHRRVSYARSNIHLLKQTPAEHCELANDVMTLHLRCFYEPARRDAHKINVPDPYPINGYRRGR